MEEAFCRDVPPESLPSVAASLGDWLASASGVLQGIEQRIDWTLSATAAAEKQRADAQSALEGERKSIRTTIELQVGGLCGCDGWGELQPFRCGVAAATLVGVPRCN